jgi:hypothetical protein
MAKTESIAKTYLILKYGSILEAYRAWTRMSYKEEAVFTTPQRQVLMDFEFDLALAVRNPELHNVHRS